MPAYWRDEDVVRSRGFDITDAKERRAWIKALGVSEDELRKAFDAVCQDPAPKATDRPSHAR